MENPPSVPISSLRRANCELQGFIAFFIGLEGGPGLRNRRLAVWWWLFLFKLRVKTSTVATFFATVESRSVIWRLAVIYMQGVQNKYTQVRSSERKYLFHIFAHVVCEFQTTQKQVLFLLKKALCCDHGRVS